MRGRTKVIPISHPDRKQSRNGYNAVRVVRTLHGELIREKNYSHRRILYNGGVTGQEG